MRCSKTGFGWEFLLTLVYFLLIVSTDVIQQGLIIEVEQANNVFTKLPWLLFVALSVSKWHIIFCVFNIIHFYFLSQTLYFNPLFLFFGYNFYNVTTNNNIKIFIVSKKTIKNPKDIGFNKLKRINNFTFIDKENELFYSKKKRTNNTYFKVLTTEIAIYSIPDWFE